MKSKSGWRVVCCLALALSTPVHAQPAPVKPAIVTSEKAVTIVPAQIGLPQQAGLMTLESSKEYGPDGFDSVIQYASPDKQINGTVFVYFPSLPDTGLTFLATDAIIRKRFGKGTEIASDQLTSVGGVADAGRKIVYRGASDGTRSTVAMFVRAGNWIIVLRMSGPASRAQEIEAQIDAIAAQLTFGKDSDPRPATSVAISKCDAVRSADAEILRPSQAAALEGAVIAVSHHVVARKTKLRSPLVPQAMCLTGLSETKDVITQSFQTVDPTPTPRRFRLVGDAGLTLETVVSSVEPGVYIVTRYGIGVVEIYGAFRGVPSEAQLDSIVARDRAIPIVARVELKAEGGSDITLYCANAREGCTKKSEK